MIAGFEMPDGAGSEDKDITRPPPCPSLPRRLRDLSDYTRFPHMTGHHVYPLRMQRLANVESEFRLRCVDQMHLGA